jgi:hypothetical protein
MVTKPIIMKKLLLIFFLIFSGSSCFAHSLYKDTTAKKTSIQSYKNKTYIFDGNLKIGKCDAIGNPLPGTVIAYKGSLFTVVHSNDTTHYLTIAFVPYIRNTEKQSIYNYRDLKSLPKTRAERSNISQSNIQYFLLKENDFTGSASEYMHTPYFDVSFGTLVTPIKFRPTKSLWTSNLSLGASVNIKHQINDNSALGGILGFSITSVSLDSASTNYKVKTSTDRPAYTPSLSFVYSYKNVNFLAGIGFDFINKTSIVEQSWIFSGKPWLGFGIGVNLFTANSGTPNKTTSTGDQGK